MTLNRWILVVMSADKFYLIYKAKRAERIDSQSPKKMHRVRENSSLCLMKHQEKTSRTILNLIDGTLAFIAGRIDCFWHRDSVFDFQYS